jgi:plastocyanin
MKKPALIILGTLAAVVAGALPATVAAHGENPHGDAMAVATALKNPLSVSGGARLTIVHVQKGCHSWSSGRGAPATGVKAVLRPGQRLTVVNQDLDTHKLVSLQGPKIALGPALSMNDRVVLTFGKRGVYKLRTTKVETMGMPEIKTTGRDHLLVMLVVVR